MIYLDHHATTPVDARVLEAMLPFFTEKFGNAASKQHRFGWDANDAVERARKQVAALIGAGSKDIVFTSGATEANNLAIKGAAEGAGAADARSPRDGGDRAQGGARPDCERCESDGWRVTVVPVKRDGLVDLAAAGRGDHGAHGARERDGGEQRDRRAAADQGSWPPLAHAKGAWFHTDAVQAVGKVPFDVEALDVDLASITAHKIYGPKGVGALYVRRKQRGVRIAAQIDGGGHERGMRSGTLNVPGIVGFGRAAEIARAEMPVEAKRVATLRDRLLERLRADDGRDDGERHAWNAAVARQPERQLRRHRWRGAAGEPRRHRRVIGRGVHAGGTVARAVALGSRRIARWRRCGSGSAGQRRRTRSTTPPRRSATSSSGFAQTDLVVTK